MVTTVTDQNKINELNSNATVVGAPQGVFTPKPTAPPTPAELRGERFDPVKFAQDSTAKYKSDIAVSNYEISLPQYVTALETQRLRKKPTPSDDLQLLYIAAKIWDPGSVVRENEQASIQNLQPTIQRIGQQFGKEVLGGGLFTDQGRKDLMATLDAKIKMQRVAYDAIRSDYVKRAEAAKIDPTLVVGTDYNKIYAPQLKDLNKPVTPSATELPKAPATQFGAQGSDLEGYRFSPQGTAEIISYIQKPGFTKEGYADVVAGVALKEGIATPENVGPYRDFSLNEGARLAKLNDVTRSAISGFDYSKADAQATKNAGLLEAATQTVKNIPASAANLLVGIASLPIDAVKSVMTMTPQGTTKTTIDLVKDLAAAAGMGDADGKTLSAVGDALAERYGGYENLKRTLITDPVGFAGDVSLLATGTGAAAKVAGLTRTGEVSSAIGTRLDPLSFLVESARGTVPPIREAIKQRVPVSPRIGEFASDVTASAVGFPSGIGPETVSTLYQAGRTRPFGAATTQPYEAATAGLREPESITRKTVDLATQSVRNLRNLASQQYKQARQQFGAQAQPVNFDDIRQTIQDLRPENYGTYTRKNMPTSHRAWETMRDMVEDYSTAIQKNPAKADPLAIDQFKKDLYERGSKVAGKFDTDSARIARDAYQGVRQKLVEADPLYDQMMKNYEAAQDELFQLESTFSLGGKQVRSDTANRKLLSVMRNDANTNYGERMSRGMRLAQLDPTGQLMPLLAGQMASSATPRGLSQLLGGGYGTVAGLGAASGAISPLSLAALPAFMPRVAGEASLLAGRTAASLPSLSRLVEAYSQSPAIRASALAGSQYGAGAQNVEQDLINADLTSLLAPQGRR
jgi:hypothetical protein